MVGFVVIFVEDGIVMVVYVGWSGVVYLYKFEIVGGDGKVLDVFVVFVDDGGVWIVFIE